MAVERSGTSEDSGALTQGLVEFRHEADPLDRQAVLARVQQELFADAEDPLTIGRFVVAQRLGAGASGVVYAAYDPKLDRRIALKLLRPDHDLGDDAKPRLQREAKALARLSHPHVVAVHDVGDLHGRVFIAMELLSGGTLRQWIAAEERSPQEILEVYLQAGEGLAAAHEGGLVHRDFKPDNVLLDERGRAHVVDFGLAREQADPSMSMLDMAVTSDLPQLVLEARLTHTGAVLGTPAYMAPEQLKGRGADARTDQYSFCIALYEALYGERPFAGDTLAALCIAAERGEVRPAPSGRKIPQRTRRALLVGLRSDPTERHASMATLLAALRRDPWPRRRRVGLGAVALSAAIGVTWSVAGQDEEGVAPCSGFETSLEGRWDTDVRDHAARTITALPEGQTAWDRVRPRFDTYADQWIERRRETCEASQRGEQSAALLDRQVLCLDRALVSLDAAAEALTEINPQTLPRIDSAVPDLSAIEACGARAVLDDGVPPPLDPSLRAELQQVESLIAKAATLRQLGRYREALAVATPLVARAAALEHPPTRARALQEHAATLGVARRVPEAVDALSQAMAHADRGRADRLRTRLASLLALRLADEGEFEEATRQAQQVEAMYERLAAPAAEARLVVLVLQGHLELAQGHHEAAIERFDAAIANVPANDDIDQSIAELRDEALGHRGTATFQAGHPSEALPFLTTALDNAAARLGEMHPEVAALHDNIGAVHYRLHDLEKARFHFERSLRLREQQLGPNHESLASVLTNLGALAISEGRHSDALDLMRRSLTLTERSLGPDAAELGVPITNLALLHLHLSDNEAALKMANRALSLRTKALGAEHPATIESAYQLAYVQQEVGNLDAARDGYEHYLHLLATHRPQAEVDQIYGLIGLSDVALLQHRAADALSALEQAEPLLHDDPQYGPLRTAISFNVARALDMLGREPRRAQTLALAAHANASGDTRVTIEQWLAKRSIAWPAPSADPPP